jgi:hypothetical protein
LVRYWAVEGLTGEQDMMGSHFFYIILEKIIVL